MSRSPTVPKYAKGTVFTAACESAKPAPAPITPVTRPGRAYATSTAARAPPEKPVT